MYSSKVIERSIERIQKEEDIKLKRYKIDSSVNMAADISALYDVKSKSYRRDLTKEERDFIRNEQLMCSVDFLYWAKRYMRIKTKAPGPARLYSPWESQQLLHDLMADLEETTVERKDGILITNLKARQLGMCLSEDSIILNSDLDWIPISKISVGDKLVSIDESSINQENISVVLAKRYVFEPVVKITMGDGSVLKATSEHRFLWRRDSWLSWMKVGEMVIGDEILRIGSSEKIISIEHLPAQKMIDLQTSTKTFIANGFVSHNSTVYEGALSHRAFSTCGFTGMLAADEPEQSMYLFSMMERIYDNLPTFLKPSITYHVKNEHMSFGDLDSIIFVSHGNLKADMGRGKTPHAVHLSELEKWPNTDQIDSGLIPSLPRLPSTVAFFESTGEIRGSWWHGFCNDSLDKANRFTMFFVPWYAEPHTYIKPAPIDWQPDKVTLMHAEAVRKESPTWMRGKTIRLVKDQMYFWEFTRNEYARKGKTGVFFCEYASSPREAFRSANSSIFSYEIIEFLRAHSSYPKAYEVLGNTIDHDKISIAQKDCIRHKSRKVEMDDGHIQHTGNSV